MQLAYCECVNHTRSKTGNLARKSSIYWTDVFRSLSFVNVYLSQYILIFVYKSVCFDEIKICSWNVLFLIILLSILPRPLNYSKHLYSSIYPFAPFPLASSYLWYLPHPTPLPRTKSMPASFNQLNWFLSSFNFITRPLLSFPNQ